MGPALQLTEKFGFESFSILEGKDGNCFLILICSNRKKLLEAYEVLIKAKPILFIKIAPETKHYSFVFKLRYNKNEYCDFIYNTFMTSAQYPSLILLNNCTVRFITMGNAPPVTKMPLNINCL